MERRPSAKVRARYKMRTRRSASHADSRVAMRNGHAHAVRCAPNARSAMRRTTAAMWRAGKMRTAATPPTPWATLFRRGFRDAAE